MFVLLAILLLGAAVSAGVLLFRGAQTAKKLAAAYPRSLLLHASVIIGLTGMGLWLRWSLTPHHVMYVDEPWYLEAASSLLRRGTAVLCEQGWDGQTCVAYPKSLGWPTVLAGVFAVTGTSDLVAIRTATLMGALSVPLAALCTRALGGTRLQSWITAFVVAIYATQVTWSATAETNVPGAFFELACIYGAARFIRDRSMVAGSLSVCTLCIASAIRPEAAIIAIPVLVAFGIEAKLAPRTRILALVTVAVACCVSALAIAPMWRLNSEIAAGDPFLRVANIRASLKSMPKAVIDYHLALFVLAGVAVAKIRRGFAVVLYVTGILQILIALAFHQFADRPLIIGAFTMAPLVGMLPGTFDSVDSVDSVDADARAREVRTMPSALAAGLAAIAMLVFYFLNRRIVPRRVPTTQIVETAIPRLVKASVTSNKALVITEVPTTVAHVVPGGTMSTRTAMMRGAEGISELLREREVFFVCDMYCEPGYGGLPWPAACPDALRSWVLEEVANEQLESRRYAVYRVSGARAAGESAPSVSCPNVSGGR